MLTHRRLIVGVVAVVITVHFLLTISHEGYGHLSSWDTIGERLGLASRTDAYNAVVNEMHQNSSATTAVVAPPELAHNASAPSGPSLSSTGRANATLVLLARNSDLNGVVTSIRGMEDRFNRKYNYPWVLLNDEPFTEEFKKRVSVLTKASISFGQIPRDHWYQPAWIDEARAENGRRRMSAQRIIYADSVPYRNMCRFNSGFFFQHELLKPYKYYWRVEPEVTYFCDLDYDPFVFMQQNDKVYGFTISLYEWEPTIPTLWSTVKEFLKEHPNYLAPNNSMDFLSDNGGDTYNLCHYWSNFEIADLDFWRGEAYQEFFNFLESKGGFYYERWGDAPVHSMAASLFARRDQVHFFRDIGYRHPPFQRCPTGEAWEKGRCSCDPNDTFDYAPNSCLRKYERLYT